MRETPADRQKMLSPRQNAILAAAAFARVFIREAEREVQDDESELWRATLQLALALHAIPDYDTAQEGALPMNETKLMERLVEELGFARDEMRKRLILNRQEVVNWLEAVVRACNREVYQVHDNGDIADGEIQVPWNLLQGAVASLRETQEAMRSCTDAIMDAESDLGAAKLGQF